MTDKDFLKAVLGLMPLASDDSTRYHLNGVWVTHKDGKNYSGRYKLGNPVTLRRTY